MLLCTNTDNCIYQSVNGLQCCGLKVGEAPSSVVPQCQEVCGSPGDRDRRDTAVPTKRPLSPPLSLSDSPGPPDAMLAHRRSTTTTDPRTPNMENGLCGKLNHNKSQAGVKTASIRDKISQWEGKKEPSQLTSTGTCPLSTTQKEVETVRKRNSKFQRCKGQTARGLSAGTDKTQGRRMLESLGIQDLNLQKAQQTKTKK